MAESVSIDVEESENHPLQGTGVADGFFNQKVRSMLLIHKYDVARYSFSLLTTKLSSSETGY